MSFAISHINKSLRFFAFITVLSGFCLSGYGQMTGDYRTVAAGNWNTDNIWEMYDGDSWETPTRYPGEIAGTGVVTVRHDVTLNVSPANPIGALVIQAILLQRDNNANRTLTVSGDVILSSGTLNLSRRNGYRIYLNIGGDLIIEGGSLTETANTYGDVIFNGNGTQVYTKTGGTISNDIRFTVNSGSTLDLGTSVLDGSSDSFTLSSGAGLITAHPDGISSSGASGSIQVDRNTKLRYRCRLYLQRHLCTIYRNRSAGYNPRSDNKQYRRG